MPQPSPRFITAAEANADDLGDVKGPDTSADGNIALFDGTTGKLLKAAGVVEGVATIDATTNILIGDDAGNAVDSTVPISAIGGAFLSTNTARVDPSGHDTGDDAGVVGDLSKPFLTVQAALDAIIANPSVGGSMGGVIYLPAVDLSENLTMTAEDGVVYAISFKGQRGPPSYSFVMFGSLAITQAAESSSTIEIFLEDGTGADVTTDVATTFIFLKNFDFNTATVTASGEGQDFIIGSFDNSSGNIDTISADGVTNLSVFGLWAKDGNTLIQCGEATAIHISHCKSRPDYDNYSGFSVDDGTGSGTGAAVTALDSLLGDVTAHQIIFRDSRALGSITTDSDPAVTYEDVFLKAVPPGGTTGQALEKNSNDDFDTVWNDLV